MVRGTKSLQRKLIGLQRAYAKEVRPAVRAGARVVRDEARARAVGHGVRQAIARKIVTRDRRQLPTAEIGYRIGDAKNDAFFLRFYETGVETHVIQARRRTRMLVASHPSRGVRKGQVLATRSGFIPATVSHPGLPRRPFLSGTVDRKIVEINKEIARVLRERQGRAIRGN